MFLCLHCLSFICACSASDSLLMYVCAGELLIFKRYICMYTPVQYLEVKSRHFCFVFNRFDIVLGRRFVK